MGTIILPSASSVVPPPLQVVGRASHVTSASHSNRTRLGSPVVKKVNYFPITTNRPSQYCLLCPHFSINRQVSPFLFMFVAWNASNFARINAFSFFFSNHIIFHAVHPTFHLSSLPLMSDLQSHTSNQKIETQVQPYQILP